ncbi:hypothetical protein RND71_023504 [Anisodus tanguticus]|uniref:Uncharacterized protein n=1 Tax=Anisodus tanguticus TaxID=243964 RepID=A0AAE1VDU2_9SOLA|nr:hypothetical protein RND71_023504 [Anisodus tanguticus]
MNHKAYSLLFIAFFVLNFCLSSANSRRLSAEGGRSPQGSLPYRPLQKQPICKKNILGKCIATKKPPIALKKARHAAKACLPYVKCNGVDPKMKP